MSDCLHTRYLGVTASGDEIILPCEACLKEERRLELAEEAARDEADYWADRRDAWGWPA